jgi:hypothetical protein
MSHKLYRDRIIIVVNNLGLTSVHNNLFKNEWGVSSPPRVVGRLERLGKVTIRVGQAAEELPAFALSSDELV